MGPSVCHSQTLVDLIDVSLVDEDANSILADETNRAISAIWKCKWRHLVTKFGSEASFATWRLLFVSSVHFETCASGSFWWPGFRILTKFQDFDQILGFYQISRF